MLEHWSDIGPDYLTNQINFSVDFSLDMDGDLGKQLETDTDKLLEMFENYLGVKRKENTMMTPDRVLFSGPANIVFWPDGMMTPDRVLFSGPATIVFWPDGTKTVVKCAEGDDVIFDRKTAIMWCFMKKMFGTTSHVNKMLDELIRKAFFGY